MNASKKRKSEYQKMRSAFESLDWTVPSPKKFHHWTLARTRSITWSRPEKRNRTSASWRGCWHCAHSPGTNPGRRRQYKRVNGPYTLIMTATCGTPGCPTGTFPGCYSPGPQSLRVHARRRHLQR